MGRKHQHFLLTATPGQLREYSNGFMRGFSEGAKYLISAMNETSQSSVELKAALDSLPDDKKPHD